ncbi:MAG: (2Fe-2S) ferredoxin domain-containing protein [Oscillospiraceae bacterium]|nr:(2Fe-2S) ferredoxin domain-containing protein [Oscillospiraceae bacterium]
MVGKEWDLAQALEDYRTRGAPGNQTVLISLLREVQEESGGSIPAWVLPRIAEAYGVKESFLAAVMKRIPSLRLGNTHCLELCGGPNCRKRAALAAFVEETYGSAPKGFTIKHAGCMRLCGKGPNIKWDGKIFHQADEALIRRLADEAEGERT